MRNTVFDAIARGASDAELARICREYYFEVNGARLPTRGKQWTKQAFETAQNLLNAHVPKEKIAARLSELFVGDFTASQIYYQIDKGALL